MKLGLIPVQFVKVVTIAQPLPNGWSFSVAASEQSIEIFTVGTAWLGVAKRTELAASARTVRIRVVFFHLKVSSSRFFTAQSYSKKHMECSAALRKLPAVGNWASLGYLLVNPYLPKGNPLSFLRAPNRT
jgi:hypothetical protein